MRLLIDPDSDVNDTAQSDLYLSADEPRPYQHFEVSARFPGLLICDHASNRLPRCLGDLGLDEAARQCHLAWDIGAGELTRRLAPRLGLPALLCNYSRLVVDCNRSLEDPTAFLRYSDGITIPSNVGLDSAERQWRIETLYWPYHHALREKLEAIESDGATAALISIHSFTPVLDGVRRQFDTGVLWDTDPRIALPLLDGLRALGDWAVGDNEPYSGRSAMDFTVDYHGEAQLRPHVAIEIRQDHLGSVKGIEYWAAALETILLPVLEDSDLYRPLK